jgi:hypothetical protein
MLRKIGTPVSDGHDALFIGKRGCCRVPGGALKTLG